MLVHGRQLQQHHGALGACVATLSARRMRDNPGDATARPFAAASQDCGVAGNRQQKITKHRRADLHPITANGAFQTACAISANRKKLQAVCLAQMVAAALLEGAIGLAMGNATAAWHATAGARFLCERSLFHAALSTRFPAKSSWEEPLQESVVPAASCIVTPSKFTKNLLQTPWVRNATSL